MDIYDSTSGSGSLLLNIGKSIAKHMGNKTNIKYFAQELKENTYNLTRMNLIMRGILPSNIVTRNGDTLEDDWPFFDDNDPINSYNPLYLDAVVSNPPYSQKWDPQHKDSDPRYARFGLAPKSKADYAFLLHDLYHLKPDGIMAIVLPHGVLFRGGEEGVIRKNLIENDHLDTIIGLPANIFFGTGIPTSILVLKQKRTKSDVLIVDASKGFAKEGKNNKLRACDIKKICDTVIGRLTVPGFSHVVSKQEIRKNDYNLNVPRYVDSSNPTESWDLYAAMLGGVPNRELDALASYWQALPNLRAALFVDDGTPYAAPKVADLAQAIRTHTEVQQFSDRFISAFADFPAHLKQRLIDQIDTLLVPQQKTQMGEEIFKRLATLPLIDKYQAYQLLAEQWQQIAVDLEIIQTEGFASTRVVDPNFVIKKKNGKEVEVQDGWKGRIMPFELVQASYLTSQLADLRQEEKRLAEIGSAIDEILDGLSEEEKNGEAVNESGDKFVPAVVAREAKELKADQKQNGAFAADSYEAKIIQAADLLAQEKALKATAKKQGEELHLLSKTAIESLSDAQVHHLLECKWITPLQEALLRLPAQQMDALSNKLQALVEKYRVTYADNAHAIRQSERELAGMLDKLGGNEFDLKGLAELKTLLVGNDHEPV
ncbi:N-6 DNA methylase [Pseudomonas sp. HLT2-19-2]